MIDYSQIFVLRVGAAINQCHQMNADAGPLLLCCCAVTSAGGFQQYASPDAARRCQLLVDCRLAYTAG